jgi:predicted DNA-binding transcriptional regulator YafY
MALETSIRLLQLLTLLQGKPVWTGAELRERLGVTDRTLRKDVSRLRALEYPVESTRGVGGGYRLGNGGRLPPLMLSDDEAVTVAVSLSLVDTVPGLSEASASALTKLERTLPDRLRRRVRAVHSSLDVGPANTGTNVTAPPVNPDVLAELAAAIAARGGVRFTYADGLVTADPYRLVSWQQRWYLVARERPHLAWRSYRVDWIDVRSSGASRFKPQPIERGDYASFVLREVATTGWRVHARIQVDAPAAEVLSRINPAVGVVETVDDSHCVLVTGADSLELVAVWIGMLGLDFHVTDPPELVDHLERLANRYKTSLPSSRRCSP